MPPTQGCAGSHPNRQAVGWKLLWTDSREVRDRGCYRSHYGGPGDALMDVLQHFDVGRVGHELLPLSAGNFVVHLRREDEELVRTVLAVNGVGIVIVLLELGHVLSLRTPRRDVRDGLRLKLHSGAYPAAKPATVLAWARHRPIVRPGTVMSSNVDAGLKMLGVKSPCYNQTKSRVPRNHSQRRSTTNTRQGVGSEVSASAASLTSSSAEWLGLRRRTFGSLFTAKPTRPERLQ